METWRGVEEFNGTYEVSNIGNIRNVNGRGLKLREKRGYSLITLPKGGRRVNRQMHRLVAIAFIDNPDNLPEVNHKNCIKNDNRVENLEWVSRRENHMHGVENKLIRNQVGKNNMKARLDETCVKALREAHAAGHRLKRIAAYFRIGIKYASKIKCGKQWANVK